MPTIKQVEFIHIKKFTKTRLNRKPEIFVMYLAALEALLAGMMIQPSKTVQIGNKLAQIAALKQNKAPTKIPNKYSDFSNIFSKKKTLILSDRTNLNKHAIEIKKSKQLVDKLSIV